MTIAPAGVLLMAYGTPDSLENVEPYYTHIRRGRPPSPELLQELRERYALVGGTTPLLEITRDTGYSLQAELDRRAPGQFQVVLGMKHWHPYIAQAVQELGARGIERAVGLVLAPHYSERSIAEYYGYVERALAEQGLTLDLARIQSWHLHPPFLEAVAYRVREALAGFSEGEDITVVFTAHSLPQRIVESGDPYPLQLRETSEALAAMLNLQNWTFSFQSAGRTPEPWLGPDLVDTVHTLADRGVRNILVASIGFVSDHLEILYDIDYEAKAAARERGVRLERTRMLNADPDFVAGLADLVEAYALQLGGQPAELM